jgi:hypothetical protein
VLPLAVEPITKHDERRSKLRVDMDRRAVGSIHGLFRGWRGDIAGSECVGENKNDNW